MDLFAGIVIDAVVGKLTGVITDGRKLRSDLKTDLEGIKGEMAMMNAAITDVSTGILCGRWRDQKMVEEWLRQTRELAYDIEDCLDLHTDTGGLIRRAKTTLNPRTAEFAETIKHLRLRAAVIAKKLESIGATAAADGAAPAPDYAFVPEHDLVGIEKPKNEVLDLLQLEAEPPAPEARNGGQQAALLQPKPKPLRVVSIVGPRGLGKTALARVVYEGIDHDDKFDSRAWVVASECVDGSALLAKILLHVRRTADETSGGREPITTTAELGPTLRRYLQSRRR